MATGTSTSAVGAARMDPHTARRGMFVIKDGRNVLFTFLLLIFLFALWGFCNGMIDVMDKHFQEVLHLNLSQSAWVQFALSRLLPDGDACGLAGDEARLQRRDHHWSADNWSGRVLVYSGDAYLAILGVSD